MPHGFRLAWSAASVVVVSTLSPTAKWPLKLDVDASS